MDNIIPAAIIGLSLVVAGFLASGPRYAVSASQYTAFVVDTRDGSVRYCTGTDCRPVKGF